MNEVLSSHLKEIQNKTICIKELKKLYTYLYPLDVIL
jgi:hypothetical protein